MYRFGRMRFVVAYTTRIATTVGLCHIQNGQIATNDFVLSIGLDLDAILEPRYFVHLCVVLDYAHKFSVGAECKCWSFRMELDRYGVYLYYSHKTISIGIRFFLN